MTLKILVAVLDRGDGEDDEERERGEGGRDGVESGEELEDDEDYGEKLVSIGFEEGSQVSSSPTEAPPQRVQTQERGVPIHNS